MIYQFKVMLEDSKPPIWRRFLVDRNITFLQLHKTLQAVMGWEDYHLFEFNLSDKRIVVPTSDSLESAQKELDANKEKIDQHFIFEGQKATYIYDFGDYWAHHLVLEKILLDDEAMIVPSCLEGQRNCPPEDSGGISGYEYMLSVLSNPQDSEYEDVSAWLGDFDPDEFHKEKINQYLKRNASKLNPKQVMKKKKAVKKKTESKLTIPKLKKHLKSLSTEELIQLVTECYKLNNGIKDFLTVQFLGDNVIEELFYACQEKVKNEFFPERGEPKLRLGEAKKAIREFEKITQNERYSIELKLYYVELGVEFTNAYGDIDERFYSSIESMYKTVIQMLNDAKNREWHDLFGERVRAVVKNTEGIGWGFHDSLAESYDELGIPF
ncbi:plasmid pRiA4b ORF-3 family protein [Shimazuella sp. AN120528]|uniref:DUF6155 family protein n=1 Tax=Shimazuella soli TaxID=1892854 RepID=UPI001F0E2D13|nr:DUF6155 family protein [Shimazuella soli]MCH5583692.1 plasmid pRiA4b ORF-3 family protein [Shimazuella soli]